MILDSNILIYAARGEYAHLLDFMRKHHICVSAVTRIEVYGYPGLTDLDKVTFDRMFRPIVTLPVDETIIEKAILLRQMRKMSLGDSIIAATALCHDQPLATRNTADFEWIEGLQICNPVDDA